MSFMQIKSITLEQVVLHCIGVHSLFRSLVVGFIVEPHTQTSQVSVGILSPGCEVETQSTLCPLYNSFHFKSLTPASI